MPLDEEEDDRHRRDRQHILEEEDEAIAEEKADSLEIDGCPRHQLSGLMTVVEAEREPDEMGVHLAPHVHLDVECLLSGDQAPAGHEQRAYETEAHDREDGEPELMRVVIVQRLVD